MRCGRKFNEWRAVACFAANGTRCVMQTDISASDFTEKTWEWLRQSERPLP